MSIVRVALTESGFKGLKLTGVFLDLFTPATKLCVVDRSSPEIRSDQLVVVEELLWDTKPLDPKKGTAFFKVRPAKPEDVRESLLLFNKSPRIWEAEKQSQEHLILRAMHKDFWSMMQLARPAARTFVTNMWQLGYDENVIRKLISHPIPLRRKNLHDDIEDGDCKSASPDFCYVYDSELGWSVMNGSPGVEGFVPDKQQYKPPEEFAMEAHSRNNNFSQWVKDFERQRKLLESHQLWKFWTSLDFQDRCDIASGIHVKNPKILSEDPYDFFSALTRTTHDLNGTWAKGTFCLNEPPQLLQLKRCA